jgi:hypothetical protein
MRVPMKVRMRGLNCWDSEPIPTRKTLVHSWGWIPHYPQGPAKDPTTSQHCYTGNQASVCTLAGKNHIQIIVLCTLPWHVGFLDHSLSHRNKGSPGALCDVSPCWYKASLQLPPPRAEALLCASSSAASMPLPSGERSGLTGLRTSSPLHSLLDHRTGLFLLSWG